MAPVSCLSVRKTVFGRALIIIIGMHNRYATSPLTLPTYSGKPATHGYNKPDVSFKQILERETRKQNLEGKKTSDSKKDDGGDKQRTTRQRKFESRTEKDDQPNGTGKATINQEYIEDHEDHELGDEENQPNKKIGAKKLRKIQEKKERRLMREEMEMDRQERKQLQEHKEKLRQMEEERQQETEKQKEEEARLAKEKKETEERELYLELKKEFELTEEGQDEIEDEKSMSHKLEEFVSYMKDNKVVLLEHLASHFGLRTQDAIDRVQELLKNETITGVIDDRGKFIYVSQQELEEVANFVKRRGRVAISEIAAASNKLVNLAP